MKPKVIEIAVSKLKLRPEGNRELRMGRVRKFVASMDLDALGTLAAWLDGGVYYIIDGQHRKIALEQLDMGDWPVRCTVYYEKTFAEACELFLLLNDGLAVSSYDKFDKGVKAGRRECVGTKAVVEAAGLEISDSTRDGVLGCPRAAQEVWAIDEGASLRASLETAIGAWGGSASGLEGKIILGLGMIYGTYNGQVDRPAFVKKLAKNPGGAAGIIGAAKALRDIRQGSLARMVASVMLDVYNKGRRNGQLAPL